MTTENLPSCGTLRAFRRVVLVDGVVVLASAELSAMGHVTCEGISYGDGQPVHLREPGGKALVAIVGECKEGDGLYAAQDGKVSASGQVLEGEAVGDSDGGFVQLAWVGEQFITHGVDVQKSRYVVSTEGYGVAPVSGIPAKGDPYPTEDAT